MALAGRSIGRLGCHGVLSTQIPNQNSHLFAGAVLVAAGIAVSISASADPPPAVAAAVAPAPLSLTLETVPAQPLPGQQVYWLDRLRNSSAK